LISYTPIGFIIPENRQDDRKRQDIFKNKLKILKIAAAQPKENYFILRDLDIIYGWGIPEMESYLNENPDYGAVALWPHDGLIGRSTHVSTSFMMIRREAIINIELTQGRGCFCWHLCNYLWDHGYKTRYIEGKILHKH